MIREASRLAICGTSLFFTALTGAHTAAVIIVTKQSITRQRIVKTRFAAIKTLGEIKALPQD
jgi:hypothetical protein